MRTEDIASSQAVIDDTLEQMEFEETTYGQRAKSYEALLHDVSLWHFAQSKRPKRIDSPMEAGAWVVTVDYRFLGFDRYRQKRSHRQVPICIHPAVLTQLLQFWVPRTPELEEALVASMRLPFFFTEFDPEAERVTVKILHTLGRYKNVDALPDATISNVLANQALRERLAAPTTVEQQIEAVESAIITENNRLRERVEREQARRRDAETKAADRERDLEQRGLELSTLQDRLVAGETAVQRLSDELARRAETERAAAAMRGFVLRKAIPAGIGTIVVALGAGVLLPLVSDHSGIWSSSIVGSLAGLVSLGVVVSVGRKDEYVSRTSVYRRARAVNRWALALAGALLLYVFTELLGDPLVQLARSVLHRLQG